MNQSIADTRQQTMASVGDLVSFVNGRVLSESEVSLYNGYTKDFNRFTYTADKELMLDQRHRHVIACFYQGASS